MADNLTNNSGQTYAPVKSTFKLNPEAAVFAPSKRLLELNFHQTYIPTQPEVPYQPPSVTPEEPPVTSTNEKVKLQVKNKKEKKDSAKETKPEAIAKVNADGQKSKAELRAERRALQEAQRAAKAAGKEKAGTAAKPTAVIKTSAAQVPNKTGSHAQNQEQATKDEKKPVQLKTLVEPKGKKVQFFSHLQQYKLDLPSSKNPPFQTGNVHPAIIRLGLQYAKGVVCGSDARCIALLHTLKQVIHDYVTPVNKELSRDFEERLKPHLKFLQECRPLSVSMDNAVRVFKQQLTQISTGTPDAEAKQELMEFIDRYIDENICKAYEAIAMYALTKINDGDVILVFSHSSAVNTVLEKAHAKGTQFHVIVIDSKPHLHGLKTVARLVKEGIECTYALVNTLSYTMQKVTKVFLGAHALLSNGYVMARAGTAMVALVAKAHNVPVLVCCETYKFSERVHTDSFVYNELGNPEDLIQSSTDKKPLSDWREVPSLDLLNLVYDVTPPDLVSAVVTELGMLPCTSVPVVLRLKTFPQKTLKR